MGKQVVHAFAGKRDTYRPLESNLCGSSQPVAVVEGLLALYPFRHMYVADLDAIFGRGDHIDVMRMLRRTYPQLEFWVDGGFSNGVAVKAWQASDLGRPVWGSESMEVMPECSALRTEGILSLDFMGPNFLGPTALMQEAECWPPEVIAMTLARIGVKAGPDLERLEQLRSMNPACQLFAAGGVRNVDDLSALVRIGVSGVLLASALHDGKLSRSVLDAFHSDYPKSVTIAAKGHSPVADS